MSRVEWLLMGPEPFLAHCERCGANIEMPKLPMAASDFALELALTVKRHRYCPAGTIHQRRGSPVAFSGQTPGKPEFSMRQPPPADVQSGERFVANHLQTTTGERWEEECAWEVRDTSNPHRIVAGADTGANETEAKVTAFALESVVDGFDLLAFKGDPQEPDEFRLYDGPTKGLRR